MKKLLLLLLLASPGAWGTDWYMYYGKTQQCVESAAFSVAHGSYFRDPYQFRLAARTQPGYEGMKVDRFGASGLLVYFRFTPESRVVFASTKALCQLFAKTRASVDHSPNLNELR